MTDRPVSAFLLSTTLHGVVVGIVLLLTYATNQQVRNLPRVLELVAGEGDNYMAKVAPALGTPGGVKLDVPTPPAPKAEPVKVEAVVVEPVKVEPAPVVPVKPIPAPPPKKAAEVPAVSTRQLRTKVIRADLNAKAEIAKQRKAEAKQAEEEKKKLAQMTKQEYDKQNKASKNPPQKVAKISPEGIAKGVPGGSTENKTGGGGGKVLTNDNDDVLAAYDALFKQRLTRAFNAPPGLSDTLIVSIQVRSHPDGSLTDAKVVKSSGSAEFDRAVLAAIRQIVPMPPRPDGKSETFGFTFSMQDKDDF